MSREPRPRRTAVGASEPVRTERGALAALVESGERIAVDGSRPLVLDDDRLAWVVRRGPVHVFAVPRYQEAGGAAPEPGVRVPLFTAEEGELLMGAGSAVLEAGVQLVLSGGPESAVIQFAADRLQARVGDGEAGAAMERWIDRLTVAAASGPAPRDVSPVQQGEQAWRPGAALEPGGELSWVRVLAGGASFLGSQLLELKPELPALPLSPNGWLVAGDGLRLVVGEAVRPETEREMIASLRLFHSLVLRQVRARIEAADRSETDRLARRADGDRRELARASLLLASSVEARVPPSPEPQDANPLLAACRTVGDAQGIEILAPALSETAERGVDALDAIARASRIRTRRVRLAGDWWRSQHGPLLGFARGDAGVTPVALLPASPSGYVQADPLSGRRRHLDSELAAALEPYGELFYRPFGQHSVGAGEMLRFSFRGARADLLVMALYGLLGGLLALALPLITAPLFNEIIPTGDQRQLGLAMAALTVAGLATGALQVARGVVQVRVEGRADSTLQSALWDRLLKLPARFFRRYTAGELANRAMGLTNLRQILTGTVSTSVLTGVFSLFSFALLFFYNVGLALVAVAVVIAGLGASLALIRGQLGTLRALNVTQNRLAGTTLQFLTGIAKIRVAGAEPRAFGVWATQQAEQSRLSSRAQLTTIRVNVILAALPLAATALIFGAFALFGSGMQTGTFIAFTAAFAQGLVAMLGLGAAATTLVQAVPLYESARPILEAVPEVGAAAVAPGRLRGDIEVTGLDFRYLDEAPPVLEDVSFRASPGQFLALVGPSGSGKSTIMRLLLGFESPESGSIHYDGHDLSTLDLEAVRRQLGVVLQSSRVFPGSVLQNIVGTSALTLDDAWEAAALAGLDEDIRAMPMGMQTFIVEGGSTLSGGQRQRLLIARAIVQRPRILLFDEATSALDNQTQGLVSRALDALRATRIVIAHRLSTIMHADRIDVLVAGRIVESGRYEDLMSNPGPFQELAKRQIL